jgi:hypothetical protein
MARTTSPTTVVAGGVGIVLASIVPVVARAVFLFPVPYPLSWLNDSWWPFFAPTSAAILVVACAILAVGLRGEPAITGPRVVARVALVLFALASLAGSLLSFVPRPVGTTATELWLLGIGTWVLLGVGTVALIVAAIAVARVGVVRGVARWGLVALAALTVVYLVLGRFAPAGWGGAWIWISTAALVVQLLIGVVYVLQGAASGEGSARRREARLRAPAPAA